MTNSKLNLIAGTLVIDTIYTYLPLIISELINRESYY